MYRIAVTATVSFEPIARFARPRLRRASGRLVLCRRRRPLAAVVVGQPGDLAEHGRQQALICMHALRREGDEGEQVARFACVGFEPLHGDRRRAELIVAPAEERAC
eukprot:1679120-Pleurochrysis_carterae.AAC.4